MADNITVKDGDSQAVVISAAELAGNKKIPIHGTLDYDEVMTRLGVKFFFSMYKNIAAAGITEYVVVFPNGASFKRYVTITVDGSKSGRFSVIEDPSAVTPGASTGNPLNRDRSSGATSSVTINEAAGISGGLEMCHRLIGSNKTGGRGKTEAKISPKEDTDYIIRIVTDSNDTDITICMEWSEDSLAINS